MNRFLSGAVALFLALLLEPQRALAQQPPAPGATAQERLRSADSTTSFVIGLKDGSTFVGRVLLIQNDSVSFASSVGRLSLALADVRSATAVRTADIRNGEYWFPNPNATRLLFAPTGRMLETGEGYFSNYMIFFPGFAVGVTNDLSIGAGMSVIPWVGLGDQLFYITPKVRLVAARDVNVAIGALAARPGSSSESFGIVYGVGTFGGEDVSFTTGLGYGFVGGDFADSPVLMFGGDARLSRRFALVTENYLFPGEMAGVMASFGMRFLGEKMSFDFGMVSPLPGNGDGFAFPFVGFVANF